MHLLFTLWFTTPTVQINLGIVANIPIDTSESFSSSIVLVAAEALAVNQEKASFVCANAVSGRHQFKDAMEGCGASPGPS